VLTDARLAGGRLRHHRRRPLVVAEVVEGEPNLGLEVVAVEVPPERRWVA
jgi:hypothetical protein